MDDKRLVDLETKISFQEILIEDLQKIVNDQYLTLEKMEKNVKMLIDKVTVGDSSQNPKNEKPPHY